MIKPRLMIALIPVVLMGCIGRDIFMARSEMEQFARIKFPASAQQLQYHAERGIDTGLIMRFVIDAQDLQPFLESSGFVLPLRDGYRPFEGYIDPKLEWWDPKRAQRVAGQDDYTTRVVRKIMVDLTSPEIVTVYITAMKA